MPQQNGQSKLKVLTRRYRTAVLETPVSSFTIPSALKAMSDGVRERRWPASKTQVNFASLFVYATGGGVCLQALPYTEWTELNQDLQEQLVARVFLFDTAGRVIWNGKWNFTSDKWEDWSLTLYHRGSIKPRAHLNHLGFGWSEIPRLPKLVVGYHGIDAAGALKLRLHKLGMVDPQRAAKTYPTMTQLRYGVASNVGKKGNVAGWSGRGDTVGVPPPSVHHMHHDVHQWQDEPARHSVSFEVTDVTRLPSAFVRALRGGMLSAPTRELPQGDMVYAPWHEAMYLAEKSSTRVKGKTVRQEENDKRFEAALRGYNTMKLRAVRSGTPMHKGQHLQFSSYLRSASVKQLCKTVEEYHIHGVVDDVVIPALYNELRSRPDGQEEIARKGLDNLFVV